MNSGPVVTHIGRNPHVGYAHCGASLWGHHMPRPGKRHALYGGPDAYRSLCGVEVPATTTSEYGDVSTNVWPAGELSVTCKKCLRKTKKQ